MTVSALSEMSIISPNRDNGRSGRSICKFTPHFMAGDLSIEVCGQVFQPESRKASSNYGIGSDGRIACYVDEDDRAWTSSNFDNDSQAITVEVANIDNDTGEITTQAWQSLVRLATDVCHRYGFRLNYTGDPSGSLTRHNMFSDTDCPGPWIQSHLQDLADTVNHNLDTGNFDYSGVAGAGSSGTGGGLGGGIVKDLASAYGAGINANVFPSQEQMQQYMITIDEKSPEYLDYDKLKEADVFGVCIYLGEYFDETHMKRPRFRSKTLEAQVKAAKEANMPFGLYTTIRARTVEEAKLELAELDLTVRKYPPNLGLWFKFGLDPDKKETNKKILKTYYEKLESLGFKDQIGFYDTKEHLDTITWEDYQEDWYWWIDKHLTSLDKIKGYPSPKFFMYDGGDDMLYEPNMGATMSMFARSSGVSSGSYNGSGSVIDIPLEDGGVEIGTYATYELDPAHYTFAAGSGAREVQEAWYSSGAQYNAEGAAVIDGKMLIACTSTFGTDGDWITWVFTDGTSIETIVADEKSQEYAPWDHNPANKWGHDEGRCVLEFLGTNALNPAPYGPLGLNGKRLKQAINHGRAI